MADKPRDPGVSIWVSPPKERRRGSAPAGLSRDRIVRTVVELLDAEGVQAFTMRKLAAALDVTPMSVYWYVDNKDELLELALDEAFGDMRIPPLGDGDDWRAHLRLLAHEYRRCLHDHPWAAQLAGQFLALGPNSLFFSTSAIGAIRRTGLTGDRLGGALGLVLQFVYGFALAESQWLQRVKASGLHEDELNRVIRGVAQQADARFAENADLLPPAEDGGIRASRDLQFETGLDIALAGIDATIAADH
ncbi:TetR/AcrR family transcriptional regulator [Kitasatospora sp. KL5]|uniref:TetR/AcrR family transcriptional regulator n=1 Tax=Kitasatospora sp. KL5 TaxID=3425125 RepID=UPI003D6E39E1